MTLSDPVMRTLALIFSVFLLTAATPPIPDVLKPYIKGIALIRAITNG